mgnify:FL=1
MAVFRHELSDLMGEWNGHRIPAMKHTSCPRGIPTKLFDIIVIGLEKQGKPVDRDILSHCMDMHRTTVPDYGVDLEEWASQ